MSNGGIVHARVHRSKDDIFHTCDLNPGTGFSWPSPSNDPCSDFESQIETALNRYDLIHKIRHQLDFESGEQKRLTLQI